MNVVRIENKLSQIGVNILSMIRSLILFGNIKRIKIDRGVKFNSNLSLGKNITIRSNSELRGRGKIKIEDNVYIHENVLIKTYTEIYIGKGTTINRNCIIQDKVKIGEYCSIAPNVVIVGSNHVFTDTKKNIKLQGNVNQGIIIEDDVWIAANCTILDGIKIGKGSIVAAGAVVSKDVDAYSIVAGVPAKIIKKRK